MSAKNDIIHNLTMRLPDNFPQFFEAERKTFEDQNGGITFHGIFLALSAYVQKHYADLSDDQLVGFWEWIEWQFKSTNENLSNAVWTCFLECIAGTEAERHSRPFMPESLLEWFDGFMHRGKRKQRWFEK